MESDTQNHTESPVLKQEIPENCIVEGISMIQTRAVVLRTEGKTYREISDILETSVNTIKDWFRRGSPVYGVYKRYSKEVAYQVSTDAMHKLRLQTEKAVDTIIECLDKKNPIAVRLSASKYILDRDLPFTEKERAERADFFTRFENMLGVMGISPESLSEKSEYGDKCRDKFKGYMDYLDNMESWT